MRSEGIELNKIHKGDCLELLPNIGERTIDLIITDPFYGSSGRDGSVHLEDDSVFGNRMSGDSFIWFVRQYSAQLFRVTKNDSHCYIFSDWRKYKDVQIAFETNGWELRALIVWDKGNGMGEYWRSTHEFILFFTKHKPKKLTHGGCMNVLKFKPIRGNDKLHSCEKPVELIKYLIEASSIKGDVILDPFAGSSPIATACIDTERKFIGIEIEEHNIKKSYDRIAKYQTGLFSKQF